MDTAQPLFAFTGMDPLPIEADDDEIVTVGAPLPRVVHVEAIAPLTLRVRFDDGLDGTVRFDESYLTNIWSLLRDPDYFARVGLRYGAVSWPNEEPDMCPDAMYDEIVEHGGNWVLKR